MEAIPYDLALKNLSAMYGLKTGFRGFSTFMSKKVLEGILDFDDEKDQDTELVYICAVNNGADEEETQRNAEKARAFGCFATVLGQIPVVPHLVWPAELFVPSKPEEDSDQEKEPELHRAELLNQRRELSMDLIKYCDCVWVFRDGADTGEMEAEILLARLLNKPIHVIDLDP